MTSVMPVAQASWILGPILPNGDYFWQLLYKRSQRMPVLLSVEKRKSFKIPFEELFLICEKALLSLGLQVSEVEQSSGVIQARKPGTWPFKSKETVSITVGRDSKVVVIAKIDMGKALAAEALIVDQFFNAVNESIQKLG